jgi:hypothetical protein
MLRTNEIASMNDRRKEIRNKKADHAQSGQCTGAQTCKVCQGFQSELKEMDEIAADHGRI